MESNKVSIVVTSIFQPNKSLMALASGAKLKNWDFLIVGDFSSPKNFHLDGASYFDLQSQKSLKFKYAALCPERHYTRKNIGYLLAINNGSTIIVETDDDNIPYPNFWLPRRHTVSGKTVLGSGWANVYSLYSTTKVWPRGLPLEELRSANEGISVSNDEQPRYCPIQQGLADENPDVDAVFRMVLDLPLRFDKKGVFHLSRGLWSPFNSQNTTWLHDAFPLLYLPSFCTFRMTDIWRSFVAQRIMWECDWTLMYHDATVWQERNEHSLIKDFQQEVPGYINNHKIKTILEQLHLQKGKEKIGENMLMCYEALIRNQIITDSKELVLLSAWLDDIQQ